jgi:hypothetical protein
MFKLEIATGNAAFFDANGFDVSEAELPHILRALAAKIEKSGLDYATHTVRDTNGNTIGTYEYTD